MSNPDRDRRAPMAAAPMRYTPDGSADWGNMWESFCELALDGGPPHRGELLRAPHGEDPNSPAYQAVASEIARGIALVSELTCDLERQRAGWLAVNCPSAPMARWLAEAIVGENVAAEAEASTLWLPCGSQFQLTGEIKNVITAVAKTTHYWGEHLPNEVKQTLAVQVRLEQAGQRLKRLFGR